MLNSKTFLSLLLTLLLGSACTPSKEVSDEEKMMNNESAAQFIVVDQGYDVTPQPQLKISKDKKTGKINNAWRIEQFRDYTFKVCLNDRHDALKLRHQKFSVNTFQGEKRGTTAHDGCFRWVETIEYNYFADATYILLKRKIKGIGSYRGIFNLEIAVNPWTQRDQTGEEAVFLKPKMGVVSDRVLVKGSNQIRKGPTRERAKKILISRAYRYATNRRWSGTWSFQQVFSVVTQWNYPNQSDKCQGGKSIPSHK